MITQTTYDVVVVGGSVGGCTTAMLLARHGLTVALLERSPDLAHYKKICTHFLQPAALPIIQRLGLDARIEAAGGVPNELEVWTPAGWIRDNGPNKLAQGYNIRRQTLDPLLRELMLATPGIDYFPGTSACELVRGPGGRTAGVVASGQEGLRIFKAPLVVAADGRASALARMAGIAARQHENDRFTYFMYFRDLPVGGSANARYWHMGANFAFASRNDDHTTLLGLMMPRSELKAFKADPDGNFRRFWAQVPEAPLLGAAQPISELRGITEIHNQWRPASAPGLAFVGDAATVLDPIWGTGCTFAFLSADWLREAVLPAFAGGTVNLATLDRGLKRYARTHRGRTWAHYHTIASFSRVGSRSLLDRLLLSAATRDQRLARLFLEHLGRTISPFRLLAPTVLCRAVLVNLGSFLFGTPKQQPQLTTPDESSEVPAIRKALAKTPAASTGVLTP